MSRGLIFAAGASLAFLLTASQAGAQQTAAEVCAGMATPAEEIACLRGALAESRAGQARERGQSAAAAPVAPSAAPPMVPPTVVEQKQAAGPAPAPAQRAEQLGEEQVAVARREPSKREPAADKEQVQALAAAVKTDHLGLVTLRLDNGQLWQQAEQRGVPLGLREDRKYPVEIQQSGFGGYRMRFTELGRQIVVKRLQ